MRFSLGSRTDSPLPPLAPPSPRWAMEGDFIWLRVLLPRANMTAAFSDLTRKARQVSPNPLPAFIPHPSVCAEERRARRIRTGDCLSVASSSPAPAGPSTAGCPQRSEGTQTAGSPFLLLTFLLLTFLLATQKKSELPPGNPRLVGKPLVQRQRRLPQVQPEMVKGAALEDRLHGSRIKSGMTRLEVTL
jgi:hypothetical protein